MSKFRLGIVGGMGPLAGVELQRLVIEATPAGSDQEHLQVVCFTNPQIPDRTKFLLGEAEESYVGEINNSVKILEKAGATHIVVACNTAHARIEDIRRAAGVPILDLVEMTLTSTSVKEGSKIGILATSGTLKTGVYTSHPKGNFQWVLQSEPEQAELMEVIYRIKAGEKGGIGEALEKAVSRLVSSGAERIILGCTELSLYFEELYKDKNMPVIDPLRIVAGHVVRTYSYFRLIRPIA